MSCVLRWKRLPTKVSNVQSSVKETWIRGNFNLFRPHLGRFYKIVHVCATACWLCRAVPGEWSWLKKTNAFLNVASSWPPTPALHYDNAIWTTFKTEVPWRKKAVLSLEQFLKYNSVIVYYLEHPLGMGI